MATLADLFTSIANAIRAKGGTSAQIYPVNMPAAIAAINPQPNLQTKSASYTPTESAQTQAITADNGYDGLGQVNVSVGAVDSEYVGSDVPRKSSSDLSASGATVSVPAGYYASAASKAVASMTLPTQPSWTSSGSSRGIISYNTATRYLNIPQGYNDADRYYTLAPLLLEYPTITENGIYIPSDYDADGFGQIIVQVPSSGSSKNAQTVQSTTRTTSTSYTKLCGDITVAKTGTYHVYWAGFRSSMSGTWGTQLYIDGTAYGTTQTTFSNHCQNVHLSNVSLTANQKVSVYGRSRGSNYYAYVGQLTIIEA